MNFPIDALLSRCSNNAATGILVLRNTQAPLHRSALRATAGQHDQSIIVRRVRRVRGCTRDIELISRNRMPIPHLRQHAQKRRE